MIPEVWENCSPKEKKMNEILSFPARAGLIIFPSFFRRVIDRGGRVVVDIELKQFIGFATRYEMKESLEYVKKDAPEGGVLSSLLVTQTLDIHQMCAIMAYLGGAGWPMLETMRKNEEKNVLIGYLEVAGKKWALIVEHEFNKYHGNFVEEINLNMREPDHFEVDPVVVLKITDGAYLEAQSI